MLNGGIKMFDKDKKSKRKARRGKGEWDKMTPTELSQRIASRYGRIEILKMEIKQLQELVEKKSWYKESFYT